MCKNTIKKKIGKIKGKPIKLNDTNINKIEIRFQETFKFLSCSLDELANNLDKSQFKEHGKQFPRKHLDLITKR